MGRDWSTWAAPAMQSWDWLESKSLQCPRQQWHRGTVGGDGGAGGSTAALLVGTTSAWQSPHGLQGSGKKWKYTKTLGQKICFHFFFLRCTGAYVKGRGKTPASLPLHLPRGCSMLTLPGLHMWADLSACVEWQDETCGAWGKAPWSPREHFHWSEGLWIGLFIIHNGRYCTRANSYFGGSALPCCPFALSVSQHHQQNQQQTICPTPVVYHTASPSKCWNLIICLTLLPFRCAHCLLLNMAMSLFSFLCFFKTKFLCGVIKVSLQLYFI